MSRYRLRPSRFQRYVADFAGSAESRTAGGRPQPRIRLAVAVRSLSFNCLGRGLGQVSADEREYRRDDSVFTT
jgi:hypothetical protein